MPDLFGNRPAEPAAPLDHAGDLILTTNALADLFGVSAQAVRKWVSSGCPREARGRFKLGEVMRWWLARRDVNATAAAESARESLLRAQERKVTLETDLLDRTTMEVAAHEAVVAELLTALRDALAGAPQRLTRDPVERAKLEDLTNAAREHVAGHIESLADRRGGGGAGAETATAPARRRVGRPSPITTR